MGAVDYHGRETVKALIDHGCDVNSATSEENGGMTPLHFITRAKFHFEDDNILELLLEAGADFSTRTLLGGKQFCISRQGMIVFLLQTRSGILINQSHQ
jgi:ankyrin repeat protein